MKKSEDTSSSIGALPRRFNGWGILLASLALTAFIFLVIGPVIERNAHLEALEDLEDQERLKRGLLMLCNTRANLKHLNEQLAQKSLEERNRVTPVVQTLGCLPQLDPSYRAEYYLWHGQGEQDEVANVVAQGRASIEPAIDALDSEKEEVRHRALNALMAMHEQLNEDHRQRIARRLLRYPATGEVRRFAMALGLEDLFSEEDLEEVEDTLRDKPAPTIEPSMKTPSSLDGSGVAPPMDTFMLPSLRLQAPSMLLEEQQEAGDESPEEASGDDDLEEESAKDIVSGQGPLRLRAPSLGLPGAPAILYARPPEEGAEVEGEDAVVPSQELAPTEKKPREEEANLPGRPEATEQADGVAAPSSDAKMSGEASDRGAAP